jgi:diguanylate cyclase
VADKIAAGGVRLAMRATLALLLGFALTWWVLGFPTSRSPRSARSC